MSKKPHTRINRGDLKGALLKIQAYQLKGVEDYSISSIRREFRVGIQRSVIPDMRNIIVNDELVKEVRNKSAALIKQCQLRNQILPKKGINVEDAINFLFHKLMYELEMARTTLKKKKALFNTCMEVQALNDATHFKQQVGKYVQMERDCLQSIVSLWLISTLLRADKAKVGQFQQTVNNLKSCLKEESRTWIIN